MSTIVNTSVTPLDLPLEHPFTISLGTQHEAANVLVTVETENGVRGYGEGAPNPPVTGETQGAALETASAATSICRGRPVAAYRSIVRELRETFPGMVSALFALETAIIDAYCRERQIPMAELFGAPPRPVTTDYTIPLVTPDEARSRTAQATARGYSTFKVKCDEDLSGSIARVEAVANETPDGTIRVDANQSWSPKETATFAARLRERDITIELIEQPVAGRDISGLRTTRDLVSVPIAADEAVFTPADALRIVREGAADVLNIKLCKSGLLGAMDCTAIARAANVELMIGCMLESSIGIHTSAHLVAGSGAFDYVDLDGNRLLARDVTATMDDGPVHDVSGFGHGVVPEPRFTRDE